MRRGPHDTQPLALTDGIIAYDVDSAGPIIVLAPGMADTRAAYRHHAT